MFRRITGIWLLLLFLSAPLLGAAGPINDDCDNAFPLKKLNNWCSSPRQFTNHGATPSGLSNPGCFTSYLLDSDNDVWFRFTARATTLNISVIGAIAGDPKGTMQYPQLALYRGSCHGDMTELACISDSHGYNIVETFVDGLNIGQEYFIRIGARNGKTGTFQLCVNNYNPVPSPSSDCATAVVLCDKSSFTVPSVTNAGRDRYELPPGICLQDESQSAWYKWTCDKPGSLTFVLKPVNPADDLDFALFKLPGGVESCNAKILYRCMASGENVNAPPTSWARCTGATGLNTHSVDVVENPGCNELDDNFLVALNMEAGESYALLVNNYHNTGNGFSIEFGGTGTFKGPTAHFVVNKLTIRQDEELWVKNASSFEGGIVAWKYNFGVDAIPQSADGKGPHKVKYGSPGEKSISLSIETGNGCQVTKVRNITVNDLPPPPPPEPEPEVISEPEPEPEIVKNTEEEAPGDDQPEEVKPPLRSAPEPETEGLESSADPEDDEPDDEPEATHAVTDEDEESEEGGTTIVSEDKVTYDVKYTATVYFQADSFSLEDQDMEILNEVYRKMMADPAYLAIVEGHTNNIPNDEYCNKLAAERANSVINWLLERGIEEDRILRKVFGKKKVRTKVPQYKNRRVYQRALVKLVKRID